MMNTILLAPMQSQLKSLKTQAEEQNFYVKGVFTSAADLFCGGDFKNCDLIVSFWLLRDADGLELLQRLKETELNKRPRIMFLMPVGTEKMEEKLYSAGADYCVYQPASLALVFERAAMLCARPAGEKRPAGKVELFLEEKGLTTADVGQSYMVRAVELLMENKLDCKLVRAVYAQIAKEENVKASAVESGIRRVIAKLRKENGPILEALLEPEGNYSNGRILKKLARKIMDEGR